jgi:hypothetical protein
MLPNAASVSDSIVRLNLLLKSNAPNGATGDADLSDLSSDPLGCHAEDSDMHASSAFRGTTDLLERTTEAWRLHATRVEPRQRAKQA